MRYLRIALKKLAQAVSPIRSLPDAFKDKDSLLISLLVTEELQNGSYKVIKLVNDSADACIQALQDFDIEWTSFTFDPAGGEGGLPLFEITNDLKDRYAIMQLAEEQYAYAKEWAEYVLMHLQAYNLKRAAKRRV